MSESSSQQRPTARRLVRVARDGDPAAGSRARRFADVLALYPGGAGSLPAAATTAAAPAAPGEPRGTQPSLAIVARAAVAPAPAWQARTGSASPDNGDTLPDTERMRALNEEQRHVTAIVRLVGQASFESMAGLRPVHQLARWLAPEPFEKLRLRVELCRASMPESGNRHYRSMVVRRSRVCRVGDRIYEASLVVADQKRVRAAALRIEQRRGHWQVQVIEIG